jgi:hypothetical protein
MRTSTTTFFKTQSNSLANDPFINYLIDISLLRTTYFQLEDIFFPDLVKATDFSIRVELPFIDMLTVKWEEGRNCSSKINN